MPTSNLWATNTASGYGITRASVSWPWGTELGTGPQRNSTFVATDPGNSVQGVGATTNATTNRQSTHWGLFAIPIGAQTIAAQTLVFSVAGSESNTGANHFTGLAIYIWRTGTGKVATLYDSQAEVGTEHTSSTAAGQNINISTSAVTTQDGDYFVVEWWGTMAPSMASAYNVGGQLGGNTANGQFKVTFANTLYLQGETPPALAPFAPLSLAGD